VEFHSAVSKLSEEMQHFQTLLKDRADLHNVYRYNAPLTPGYIDGLRTWWSELKSPLVDDVNNEGRKVLKLKFYLANYKQDEILVSAFDNKLQIHAMHEESDEHRTVTRTHIEEFFMPMGVDIKGIKSHLSSYGVLTVEAPIAAFDQSFPGPDRSIPIRNGTNGVSR